MAESKNSILEKLDRLQLELVDLAFTLERRGRPDAADVAMTASARIKELCEEFMAAKPPQFPALD